MILRLVAPLALLATVAVAQGVSPVLVRAADELAVIDSLSAVLPSLGCLNHPSARHLEELPSAQPWTRPPALVVLDSLPGQPEGVRGALVRVTRNLLARQTTQAMISGHRAVLLNRHLMTPSAGEATPFLLLLAEETSAETSDTCIPRGLR